MEIDPHALAPLEAYRFLVSVLVPRPIAWVSTMDARGRPNLAPFSFFGGVTSHPPTVFLSVGRRRGREKDTAANLKATGEAVIHVPHRPLAEAMVATSADVPPGTDEFELASLHRVPARRVRPWRLQDAAIALEARVDRHLEAGEGPNDVFFLRLLHVHLDDAFLVDGRPDPARLAAVGRLGGNLYCDTREPFAVDRPT